MTAIAHMELVPNSLINLSHSRSSKLQYLSSLIDGPMVMGSVSLAQLFLLFSS
jgi:hypothetical protein